MNEIRNIIIHLNILQETLKHVQLNDKERTEISFRLESITERLDYLITDRLADLKHEQKQLEYNKELIENLKKEI